MAETRLVLDQDRVKEIAQLFGELWEVTRASGMDGHRNARDVAVDVYLDTENEATAQQVFEVVNDLAVWLGYRLPAEVERQRGSIFWRGKTAVSGDLLPHQMQDRAERLERAAGSISGNPSGAGLPDSHEVQILALLIQSLDSIAHACIRVDRLLVLKYTGASGSVLVSCTLSRHEVEIFEQHPEIQTNPQNVLAELGREVGRGQATG